MTGPADILAHRGRLSRDWRGTGVACGAICRPVSSAAAREQAAFDEASRPLLQLRGALNGTFRTAAEMQRSRAMSAAELRARVGAAPASPVVARARREGVRYADLSSAELAELAALDRQTFDALRADHYAARGTAAPIARDLHRERAAAPTASSPASALLSRARASGARWADFSAMELHALAASDRAAFDRLLLTKGAR